MTDQDNMANFVGRYVDIWNEPDPQLRRKAIEDLWAPDGANYTDSIAAVGHDALEARVTRAYEAYVGTGEYRFRLAKAPAGHHNAVKIDWEMVRMAQGVVASAGVELLILDDDGRIASDHQFILS
jgi:SnoaL-like domain